MLNNMKTHNCEYQLRTARDVEVIGFILTYGSICKGVSINSYSQPFSICLTI